MFGNWGGFFCPKLRKRIRSNTVSEGSDLLSWVYSSEAATCRYKCCRNAIARGRSIVCSAAEKKATFKRCTSYTIQTSLFRGSTFVRIRQPSAQGGTYNVTGTFNGTATRKNGSKVFRIKLFHLIPFLHWFGPLG